MTDMMQVETNHSTVAGKWVNTSWDGEIGNGKQEAHALGYNELCSCRRYPYSLLHNVHNSGVGDGKGIGLTRIGSIKGFAILQGMKYMGRGCKPQEGWNTYNKYIESFPLPCTNRFFHIYSEKYESYIVLEVQYLRNGFFTASMLILYYLYAYKYAGLWNTGNNLLRNVLISIMLTTQNRIPSSSR